MWTTVSPLRLRRMRIFDVKAVCRGNAVPAVLRISNQAKIRLASNPRFDIRIGFTLFLHIYSIFLFYRYDTPRDETPEGDAGKEIGS